jgi:hypothetical protein
MKRTIQRDKGEKMRGWEVIDGTDNLMHYCSTDPSLPASHTTTENA